VINDTDIFNSVQNFVVIKCIDHSLSVLYAA